MNVRTFTLASYLRDGDFTKAWPKEARPRYVLHDGRISWASRKDKNVNDGNTYLLKSRNGKRKRNMVDVLSFDAREAKDTKIDSLYKTLRLFDLSYSDFARLEWLGVPETKSIPISVKDKSLRMPKGNVAVTCVEGCEREAEGMRGTLKDMGVPSGGKADVRIVVIHDAEYYKAQARSEGDMGDAQGMKNPYRGIGRSVATQCVTAETWLVADGKRSDSMRRSVMATALNELRIKQEVAAGFTDDAAVYGYFFAVPREDEDGSKGAGVLFGGRYVYLHICGDGRFEYYDGNGQPSFDMLDFCDTVCQADDMTRVDHKGSRVECVIQTPAESVAAILDTGVKAMPGDVDGLMKELRMARREADLSRGEKTAHPRSKVFAERHYSELLGINVGRDVDGSTLYSIGYQNSGLNKRMPRMVPLRRILTVEGERFDDAIIDMCNVCWIRSTYLPSVLPWPVKYLREMELARRSLSELGNGRAAAVPDTDGIRGMSTEFFSSL